MHVASLPGEPRTLVFVDGVRRREASPYHLAAGGAIARGIADTRAWDCSSPAGRSVYPSSSIQDYHRLQKAPDLDFKRFFRLSTVTGSNPSGVDPYPFQIRLAESYADIVDIPTGLGKTEAVVAAWLWRLVQEEPGTPRRLIYSLPMRSLVEQTASRIEGMLTQLIRAGLISAVELHVVMGGDVGDEWFQKPETAAIVVGTQDMLLSRALNRGYAMSRFQWPMTFGAINNDVLWVIDEVQLQGVGAVTSAQLQGLREKLGAVGPTRTLFMSATLDRTWLDTVDHRLEGRATLSLGTDDLDCGPLRRVVDAKKTIVRVEAPNEESIARAGAERHRAGTLTLIVVNTVERARLVHRSLLNLKVKAELILLHSRFRPADRKSHIDALFAPIDSSGPGRLVVSTQVVEAGIDVDAATLITDVAPWSSIVQRFGRCNRRGRFDDATCCWLDVGEPTQKTVIPYELADMSTARQLLMSLEGASGNSAALPKLPIAIGSALILRKVDLLDLFDTSPDLSGHDVDVSRFIREADDFTASVFWRSDAPEDDDPPNREELCPASLSDLRKLLKKLAERGHRRSARVANQFGSPEGGLRPPAWVTLDERNLRPGLQIWLQSDVGWYDSETGFGELNVRVEAIARNQSSRGFRDECTTTEGDRGAQIGAAVTLSRHAGDTANEARAMLHHLSSVLDKEAAQSVVSAALWHDVGKAHKVFQSTMVRGNNDAAPTGDFWAKCVKRAYHERPGFRHELASALAYLNAKSGERNVSLVAYLIAAHHGKLRLAAQPLPTDASVNALLGNIAGDMIPVVHLEGPDISPAFSIDLTPFQVGAASDTPTWVDRVSALRDKPTLGPFRLAYLELLVRIADWRASSRPSDAAALPA